MLRLEIIKCEGGEKMAKKGEKYTCGECGVIVIVDDDCGCAECDLICCGAPMKKHKGKK
jgi:hypothetical protein